MVGRCRTGQDQTLKASFDGGRRPHDRWQCAATALVARKDKVRVGGLEAAASASRQEDQNVSFGTCLIDK